MSKRIIACFMAFILILTCSGIAYADDASGTCGNGGRVKWSLNGGVLTISGTGPMDEYYDIYNAEGAQVYDVVTPWQEYKADITEVVVKSGVTSVGAAAFANLNNLQRAEVAGSVETIGWYAFAFDYSLTDIELGEGVKTIREGSFCYDPIKELKLPSSFNNLEELALNGMDALERITVASGSSVYSSRDGILFSADGKTLLMCPPCRSGSYTVPDGVTKIADSAFEFSSVSSIVLPDSITAVGADAFSSCENLRSVTFSSSMKIIDERVCNYCPNLTTVVIPEGITDIKDGAFTYCNSLKNVALPSTIKSVGKAFDKTVSIDASKTNLTQMENGSLADAYIQEVSVKECYGAAFECLKLVNKERAKEGLEPLVMDKDLLKTAMQRAAETKYYFSHTRPCGFSCYSANPKMDGENIADGYTEAERVMTAWMHSAAHKANILGGYESVGIGCVRIDGVSYWVQCFSFDTDKSAVVSASDYTDKTVTKKVAIYRVPKPGKASLTSAKNVSGRKLTAGWNKVSGASGYQVQIATNKTFTKSVKKSSVKGASTLKKTMSSLTKGKTYYVRVRAYKSKYGQKAYGSWSNVKSVKITK